MEVTRRNAIPMVFAMIIGMMFLAF